MMVVVETVSVARRQEVLAKNCTWNFRSRRYHNDAQPSCFSGGITKVRDEWCFGQGHSIVWLFGS